MIALTSQLSFHSTVSERERQVHQLLGVYLSSGPMSDREAYNKLHWEAPSVVAARRNDLVKQGRVCELGMKRDEMTGKKVKVWGIIRSTLDL